MGNEVNQIGSFLENLTPETSTPYHSSNTFDLNKQFKYFLALVEYKNIFSTCFFIDLNIFSANLFCLCTSSSFISDQNIEFKEEINIHLGDNYLGVIPIKLDINKRRILQFKNNKDIILIQVFPEIDNITKDKFIKIKNSDLDSYIGEGGKNVYVVGYQNYIRRDISYISTNIIELKDNFKIKLGSGKNSFLSCSPIYTIDDNEPQIKNKIKIIGVEGKNDILNDSSGFLFFPVIDTLEDYKKALNQLSNNIMNNIVNNDIDNNNFDIDNNINNNINISNNNLNNEVLINTIGNNNNISTNFKNYQMEQLQYNYFYTFDEYKQHVIKFHNKIARHYVFQTEFNFYDHYRALKEYLLGLPNNYMKSNENFIDSLENFK